MELHALYDIFFMSDAHYNTLSAIRARSNPGCDLQAIRKRRVSASQGVIPRHREVLRDIRIYALAIVPEGGGFAMKNLSCNIDTTPE
jgi:hypothetical protein